VWGKPKFKGLVANDGAAFQVPLTYRGSPLPSGDPCFVGMMEHSFLGTRWIYDAAVDPVYASALAADGPDHDFYRSVADEYEAESILDLGCGTGILTVTFAQESRTVVGIDPSEAMLAFARRRLSLSR